MMHVEYQRAQRSFPRSERTSWVVRGFTGWMFGAMMAKKKPPGGGFFLMQQKVAGATLARCAGSEAVANADFQTG